MKIVANALVTRNGAYYPTGGLIQGTQRFPTNHRMEYWQQGNVENTLAIDVSGEAIPSSLYANALYAGRIPLHFGHFLMEGLPKMCDAVEFPDMPLLGYYTEGFLPDGIEAMDIESAKDVVGSFSNGLTEIEEGEIVAVEKLFVPELPMLLSQSCSEPWRMTEMISRIVEESLERYPNTESPEWVFLQRLEDVGKNDDSDLVNNPTDDVMMQIAKVSKAKGIRGNVGSNTHLSMFASRKAKINWRMRGDYEQADRNQHMCDLVRTYNRY